MLKAPRWRWLGPVFLAAVGTACSEPQTAAVSCWDEVAIGDRGFGQLNEAQVAAMRAASPDEPFYMLNLIAYRDAACYRDGRPTELSGQEADALYQPKPFLDAIGADIVYAGPVHEALIGDDIEWDTVGVVRYPSAAAFFSMVDDPAFAQTVVHKEAGVERSLVMVASLRPSVLPEGFTPSQSEYPASADNPAVDAIHLMRFHDTARYPEDANEPTRSGEEAVGLYEAAASGAALGLGVYPIAWFDIQGVYVGDERAWDQLRINRMPSRTAFDVLVANPERKAGEFHRSAGLQDTYSVLAQPLLDTLDPIDADPDGNPEAAGVGQPCTDDSECGDPSAPLCIHQPKASGFCSVQGCGAGDCADGFLCCEGCSEAVESLLGFAGSACFPPAALDMLTGTAGCTCD